MSEFVTAVTADDAWSNTTGALSWGDIAKETEMLSVCSPPQEAAVKEMNDACGAQPQTITTPPTGIQSCKWWSNCTKAGCTYWHLGQNVPEGETHCRFWRNCASLKDGGKPCEKWHPAPWTPPPKDAPKDAPKYAPAGLKACLSGDKCKSLKGGKQCTFWHPSDPTPPAGVTPCSKGGACHSLRLDSGKLCTYWHAANPQPPANQRACKSWAACRSQQPDGKPCTFWHPPCPTDPHPAPLQA